MSKYNKSYYQQNKDRIRIWRLEYYQKNREKIRQQIKLNRDKPKNKKIAKEYAKKYRIKNGDKLRKKQLEWYFKNEIRFKRYNFTKEQYEELLKKQNNKCAICKEEKTLVIDHDHIKNKIRGLLCHSCNKGLGCFYDNPEYLERAKNYV